MTVAVLFARADSNYKALPDVDVWDAERDARNWPGGCPVVAHPPCRAWGRLSHMANPRPDEMNLARLAVALVREFGGVLEHPNGSRLWAAQKLPRPGERDSYGGWTLGISQHWWGHRAEKKTLLYIVGCEPSEIPTMPEIVLGSGTHVIAQDTRKGNGRRRLQKGELGWRPFVTHAEREHTPPALAQWLVELAAKCKTHNVEVSGLRGFSRRSARLPGWASLLGQRWQSLSLAPRKNLSVRECQAGVEVERLVGTELALR